LPDPSAALGAAQDYHSPIPARDAGGPASQVASLVAMLRAKDRQLVLLSETVADQARALRVRTVAEDEARDPIIRELWDDYE